MTRAVIAPGEHRPWSIPSGPPVMRQSWHDLLFAHWPVDPAKLQGVMPAGLPLDTFEGKAWVGVVPFRMSGIQLRGLPVVPFTSAFAELNVRTYVSVGGKPGVFFFCLDASNPLAVEVARRWYHLPDFRAKMSAKKEGNNIIYASERTDRRGQPARFQASYGPTSEIDLTRPGTIESWLTERYALYAVSKKGRVYRGEIHHQQWPLQPAQADIRMNTMSQAHGIELPDSPPLLHFSRRLDVVAWSIRPV